MGKRISIIVPVFNVEKYLPKCIESLLEQDYINYEIILINDGSCDKSGIICDEYALKYNRIVVVHQENKGVSAARNAGLILAKGDYITFVDSDDWIEPNYLTELEKYMRQGSMVICDLERSNKKERKSNDRIYKLDKIEACALTTNPKGLYGRIAGRLFDKKIIDKHYLAFDEDISIAEDGLFCVQYLYHTTETITWIPSKMYHYRFNPESATNTMYTQGGKFHPEGFPACIALEKEIEYVRGYPDLVRAFRARQVTEKRNALRVMVINNWKRKNLYKEYLHDIRKGVRTFLSCDIGQPFSEKVGVILACISPELECFIWEIWKSNKRS